MADGTVAEASGGMISVYAIRQRHKLGLCDYQVTAGLAICLTTVKPQPLTSAHDVAYNFIGDEPMAVEVTLNDGRRRVLNGRAGTIIEWVVNHAEEIVSYKTLKIEIDCSLDAVKFTRGLNEKITVQD